MSSIQELETRRDEILEAMRSIRSMKRGTINEQYMKVPQKKGPSKLRGPYYVLSRREGNRTVSHRLSTKQDLDKARYDVKQHKNFLTLCKQFVDLTERLGELEQELSPMEQEKKRRRLSSKKTAK